MAIDAGYDYANDGGDRYGSNSKLLEIVDGFDKSNQALHELIAEIANNAKISGTDGPALSHYASQVAASWNKVVSQLANDIGIEGPEFANVVAGMWVQDETERANAFNMSIPESNIGVVMDGSSAELSRNIYASYEDALLGDEVNLEHLADELVNELCRSYSEKLKIDVKAAFNAVIALSPRQSQDEALGRSKRDKMWSHIGKEVLSAAKIAAGVATGIVIGQWLNKKS